MRCPRVKLSNSTVGTQKECASHSAGPPTITITLSIQRLNSIRLHDGRVPHQELWFCCHSKWLNAHHGAASSSTDCIRVAMYRGRLRHLTPIRALRVVIFAFAQSLTVFLIARRAYATRGLADTAKYPR